MLGHNEEYYCCLDGNAFCVHRHDFIDLQESEAGFGDTEEEALADLLSKEAIVEE